MGSLKHPSADLARKAFAERDFHGASAILDVALLESPGEPDVACEAAILSVYAAKEDEAFELLPIAEPGHRFKKLISLLADHYTSRLLFDRTDHDAKRRLQLIRTFEPTISKHNGVKICACLIIKNEEKYLARCLESLQGAVDQIVVVDTGSTDASVEIAVKYGARVAEFAWCDDFSAARNYALSLASGHWILSIDADEELTPETHTAFERAVIRPQFGGFDVEIVNYLENAEEGEKFRHCPTRLFRNLPGVKFTGRIHEQVNPSLVELGLPWARVDGATILHYGYRPEVMNEKAKIQRTISLLEKEVSDDAENGFQWFNLANAHLVARQPEQASSAAKISVNLLNPSSGFGVQAYSILLQAHQALGKFDEALKYADEAMARGFDCLQLAFEKCSILIAAGRFEEALTESLHMMSLDWPQGATGDVGIFTHKRYVLCAQIFAHLQQFDEALASIDKALAAAPEYGPSHFVQAHIFEKLGRLELAIECLQRAALDPSCFLGAKSEAIRLLTRQQKFEAAAHICFEVWMREPSDLSHWAAWKRQCEATGNPLLVLECYEQFAAIQPVSSELLVDWGRCCATFGRNPQALKCYADAIQLNPTHANAYFNGGDLLYSLGMPDQAVEMFTAGLKYAPEHTEGWFVLGNALARSGREAEAISVYEKLLAKEPRHERARYNLNALKAA